MIDKKTVDHIAALARIDLSLAEKDAMLSHLNAILTHIDALGSIDTTHIEPTCYVTPDYDPTRPDTVSPSLPQEIALANGPDIRHNHFAIPRVIG